MSVNDHLTLHIFRQRSVSIATELHRNIAANVRTSTLDRCKQNQQELSTFPLQLFVNMSPCYQRCRCFAGERNNFQQLGLFALFSQRDQPFIINEGGFRKPRWRTSLRTSIHSSPCINIWTFKCKLNCETAINRYCKSCVVRFYLKIYFYRQWAREWKYFVSKMLQIVGRWMKNFNQMHNLFV